MHLKINEASKRWPVSRKGRTFLVVPSADKENRIPLLLIMREMLHLSHTRREAKLILNEGKVVVNGKVVKNEKLGIGLFDIVEINGKKYRLILNELGKFAVDSSSDRFAKIIGKKIMSKGVIQINLSNGNNFVGKEDYKVGDTIMIKDKNHTTIHLKEGVKVVVIGGKTAGTYGNVRKIAEGFATIETQKGEKIIRLNEIMAIK